MPESNKLRCKYLANIMVPSTDVDASYLYDGNMKRVRTIVDNNDGEGEKTIYNVYDSSGRLVHVDEYTDGKETDYLHGMGQTIARIKNGEFTYLHPDHLGSPQAGTSETGTVAFTEHYTPFGEALLNPAANDNQSGFTGHIKDKSTGLNYMQARYYDPNIGRFLSVDPVDFMISGGNPTYINRYSYVGNDPINMIDPFGLCGNRYDDGSCQVKVDSNTGDAGVQAGKDLEATLNKYDKAINNLADDASITIRDDKGNETGSITGEELKTVWNETSFSVTSKGFNNGGAGGGATGGFKKNGKFSGKVELNTSAVNSYQNGSVARGGTAAEGTSTLVFHELGHLTRPGNALTKQYPVSGPVMGAGDWKRERGTNSIARASAFSVGASYSCSLTGGCR